MPAEPTIDYEALAQDAMRGVVRTVLVQAAKSGLPGDHHFYISFDTVASGVVLSKRLKEKYPSEMTIVLQHRFWDLLVSETGFEVKLTFDGIPERLVVPFTAIRVFFDPSVRYGMQFESPEGEEPDATESVRHSNGRATAERANAGGVPTLRPTTAKKSRVPRKTKAEAAAESLSQPAASPSASSPSSAQPEPPAPTPLQPAAAKEGEEQSAPRQDNGGAQIVRLDAFRKK